MQHKNEDGFLGERIEKVGSCIYTRRGGVLGEGECAGNGVESPFVLRLSRVLRRNKITRSSVS